jgi:hypothetical protein
VWFEELLEIVWPRIDGIVVVTEWNGQFVDLSRMLTAAANGSITAGPAWLRRTQLTFMHKD